MKKLLLLMTVALSALSMSAQTTKVITGAVIDKNGNPIPNALVEATGGAESVTTGADGTFRIEVPFWLKSLTAKYAGLQDKKIKIGGNPQIIFELKPKTGSWFIDAVGSANFGDFTFGRAGLMGGYLDNWGGYAKVLLPFGGGTDVMPSATVGVIKQVSRPLYLYLGVGYTPVFYERYYYNTPDYYDGVMIDIGTIYRIKKINIGLGYSISTDDFVDLFNHSIQASVGYCF